MLNAAITELLRVRNLLILLGMQCVAILIWFVGPSVSIAGVAPLASVGARIGAIAALFVVVFAATVLRIFLARRANALAIRNLLDSDGLATLATDKSSDEIELIRERFESTMRVLKDTAIGKESGRNYMIQLPWYVVIGPPGAGKTTILKNSGLTFPLAERVGDDPVAGIGGTRYCDWWFTDEAVLIDTAGRYTTQDINSEVDKATWRGFLELLRTHRARRPINGVIIAISLADMVSGDEATRRKHVEALKKRLQELMRFFGMPVPVYVLFTKCDLVSGFSEYFEELDDTGRAQAWGTTFALDDATAEPGAGFDRRFLGLVERLEGRLMRQLHQERSIARRCRIFTFPKEFASLRDPLNTFIADVFKASRFEMRPILRGVYFTSGTQEGTPMDRLLGSMSRNFGLAGTRQTAFSGKGKAFFINRVLTDVVFEEQGLVGVNRQLERRLSMVRGLAYVATAGFTLALASAWIFGAARSEIRIGETRIALDDLERQLQGLPPNASFNDLLPTLNAASALEDIAGKRDSWINSESLGLSAVPRLSSASSSAYDRLLVTRLLPSLANRLENRIDQDQRLGTPAALEDLRTALRNYLMLGEPARFDRATMSQVAKTEAVLSFPLDTAKQSQMADHLAALMALMPKPYPLNLALISSARTKLAKVPQVDQVYARLLREGYQNPALASLDLGQVVGARSLTGTRDAQANGGLVIPGLFTRPGFYNYFLVQLPILVSEELGSDWVAGGGSQPQAQALARQIADRYVKDYVATWQSALARITPVRFNDMPRAMAVLQNLAGPQSPVDALVASVRENTDLPPPGQETNVPPPPGSAPPQVSPLTVAASKAGGAVTNAATSAALGEGPWPGKTITQPFIPLIQLASPGAAGQLPALGRIRDLLSNVYGVMSGVANAPQPSVAAFQIVANRIKDQRNDAFAALRADSALRPEPVRTILQVVGDSAWATLLSLAYQNVNQAWKQDVLPVCESSIARRYPIYADAKDEVTLTDFTDFFRPGGVLDTFFTQYMAGFVVDQRGTYVPVTVDGSRVPVSQAALSQFSRARQIRDAFFPNKGPTLLVKFSVRPTFLSPNVLRATLSVDGSDIVYRHEAPRSYDLDWPTRSDASTVSVTLSPVAGADTKVQRSGPWALFRFISASSPRGRSERQSFTVNGPDGASVTYDLRSGSVNSPFNLGALASFRCPDDL
ncbi:type VI secretion system membrane subunit TssM [Ancylobacter amanitiformis]|uniref:Type VI secretion system protein ImpL n=1 Tax=Ancylobacter amanitiformis TaxID=217069 RepID=A0ABU0LL75_9HYPH|nr:type VI secretion system membrane subunit TssM [Ancylobacter amanitiformis]MDQ0509453.1 type VI secretion system protein ImpL [Ancylobacter amanitiformis]